MNWLRLPITALAYRLLPLRFVAFASFKPRTRWQRPSQSPLLALACEAFVQRGDYYVGIVFCRGEYWSAESPAPIATDQQVLVFARRGLVLEVNAPKEPSEGVYR